jgi:hypothetical protein
MKAKGFWTLATVLVVMATALSACSINVDRNPDGSLTVEAVMDEATLQSELKAAIADPLVEDFTVDLNDGYILVSGERRRAMSDDVDTLSFRLDLGVSDGHLSATISGAELNGRPIEEARVAIWNERIATRLERWGKRHPDGTLQSVTISGDSLTMVWQVETWRSRSE